MRGPISVHIYIYTLDRTVQYIQISNIRMSESFWGNVIFLPEIKYRL